MRKRTRKQELRAIAQAARLGKIRRLKAPLQAAEDRKRTLADAMDDTDWIGARHHLNQRRTRIRESAG